MFFFVGLPHLATNIFLLNEPELGAGIDPGMAFNPFPSSIWIRRDLNPQLLDRESSSLTTRPDLRPQTCKVYFDLLLLKYFGCQCQSEPFCLKPLTTNKPGSLGSILFYASFK